VATVDHSSQFEEQLEQLPAELPPYDDAVLLEDQRTLLVTCHDGQIWKVDLDTHRAAPIVDTKQFPWGIHEGSTDDQVYFCAAGSYDRQLANAAPGIYRLTLSSGSIEAIALRVPETTIDHGHPVVYADDDPGAPQLGPGADATPSRAIEVADSLELSADGRRIYFSEPFSYRGATLDDAVDEAISLAKNGRLWRHDLDTGTTRLIAEGFHFINGVLYDPHPGHAREQSVLVSQTSLFRLTRFYLAGPKAGSAEVVLDSLPGTPDGMDRDSAGRIWLAMFTARSKLLTWASRHAWVKPLLMRLPTPLLLAQERRTGVVVVSEDGSTPLYAAFYAGAGVSSISSAVPTPRGIYLANVALGTTNLEPRPIQRLKWPRQLAQPLLAQAPRTAQKQLRGAAALASVEGEPPRARPLDEKVSAS
jgi:sugar lactone lactonase YvrE